MSVNSSARRCQDHAILYVETFFKSQRATSREPVSPKHVESEPLTFSARITDHAIIYVEAFSKSQRAISPKHVRATDMTMLGFTKIEISY